LAASDRSRPASSQPGSPPNRRRRNEELRALLDDRLSRAENYASLLVVLVILVLMVFKP